MKGRTVVATGEAAVLVLSSMGDRVVLVARNEQRAQATLNALEARPFGSVTACHRRSRT